MSDPVALPEERWQRLDPRYVTMARQAAMLEMATWLAGLSAATAMLWWLLDWTPRTKMLLTALWLLALLAAFVARWVHAPIHYRHAAWRLGPGGLEIRGGAWWRHQVRVPLSRIQHTDVSQGPLERRHQLGTLVAYTAGTEHSAVGLEGVTHEQALTLRDQLLRGDAPTPV